MIARKEILAWLHDIADEDAMIAVDEGGLTLVVVDSNGLTTNASLEIGGVTTSQESRIWSFWSQVYNSLSNDPANSDQAHSAGTIDETDCAG